MTKYFKKQNLNLWAVNKSLASVIISNYNYAYFLSQAIESVLKQTYQILN